MSNYHSPMYLGDGAYAQMDEYGDLVLSTGCHAGAYGQPPTDRIYFEGAVLADLLDYISEHAPNGSQNYTIKRIGT